MKKAKEKKPFYPTWPSTIDEIKNKCSMHGPKEMVEHLSSAVGGEVNASAPEELPWIKKQVTNLRQQANLKGHAVGPRGEVDDLFVVM